MGRELILASSNPGKIREIRALLPEWNLLTAKEVGFDAEIEEPYDSFDRNAEAKALALHRFTGKAVLAEDSGLCVQALGGSPGVRSARYAGGDPAKNNTKLLKVLNGVQNREAWYVSVLCLITPEGKRHFFEGRCDGRILTEIQGTGGFGYDPLFVPRGYAQSFGVLNPSVKEEISHRAQALNRFTQWIRENQWE